MNWACPRHLQDNRCYQVKCVVWCVMPTPRMDAVLQEQANYIHQFVTDDENTEENEDGKIWSNVLIVCKGKVGVMSLTINLIFFLLNYQLSS